MKLPHVKSPCKDCPFRKDSLKGWLGKERMEEILKQESFTCHKTNKALQCVGHMILKGDNNAFVRLADRLSLELPLSNRDLIFDNEEDCINHHTF